MKGTFVDFCQSGLMSGADAANLHLVFTDHREQKPACQWLSKTSRPHFCGKCPDPHPLISYLASRIRKGMPRTGFRCWFAGNGIAPLLPGLGRGVRHELPMKASLVHGSVHSQFSG